MGHRVKSLGIYTFSIMLAAWAAFQTSGAGAASPPMGMPNVGDHALSPSADRSPPVTLQVTGEPVVDLLQTLSGQSGPRLTASMDLGERRVHVLVRDLRAALLRKMLAQVVDGLWVRTHAGAALDLEPDPAAIRERDAILARRRKQFFTGLRTLTRQLALDQAGLERLSKTGSSAAGYLMRPASRGAVQLMALLGEPQWQELETTGRVAVSPDQLGAAGPSLMREYTRYVNEAQKEMQKTLPPEFPAPEPLDPDQTSRGSLEFRVVPQANGEPYGFLSVGLGSQTSGAGMTISGSHAVNAPETRWIDSTGSAGERVPKGSRVMIRFPQQPRSWGEVLRRVAEGLHLQVMSEEYTRLMLPRIPLAGEVSGSVPEVLDRLSDAFGYQWRMQGGVYQFRSITWYLDRDQEPPGTLVKAAIVARQQKQPLTLEWLAAAATVARKQQPKLWVHAPAAQPVVLRFQPLLLLYGSLSAKQRAALQAESGLSGEALSAQQQEEFFTALQQLAPEWSPTEARQARVRLTRQATSVRFDFTSDEKSVQSVIPRPSAVASGGSGVGLGSPGLLPNAIPP